MLRAGDGDRYGTGFRYRPRVPRSEHPVGTPTTTTAPDLLRALTPDQLFDALAIRVDGPRSWDADICVRWNVKDQDPVGMRLRNGVLTHVTGNGPAACEPDVEVTLDEDALRALLLGETPLADLVEQGWAKADGDLAKVDELLGHLGEPDPDFAIVTP